MSDLLRNNMSDAARFKSDVFTDQGTTAHREKSFIPCERREDLHDIFYGAKVCASVSANKKEVQHLPLDI